MSVTRLRPYLCSFCSMLHKTMTGTQEGAKVQVFPCSIQHEGKSNINDFFIVRPSKDFEGYLDATFRGRCLVGKEINIPEGFQGAAVNDAKGRLEGNGDEKEEEGTLNVEVKSSFSSMTVWDHDTPPIDFHQPLIRSMNALPLLKGFAGSA